MCFNKSGLVYFIILLLFLSPAGRRAPLGHGKVCTIEN